MILIEAGGQFLIGSGNGLFTRVFQSLGDTAFVRIVDNPLFHRSKVSPTFSRARRVRTFATHLSRSGTERVQPSSNRLGSSEAKLSCLLENQCVGEVQFIDEFGNIITNIPIGRVKELPNQVSMNDDQPHPIHWVRTFTEVKPDVLV